MQKIKAIPQTGFIRLPQLLAIYPVSKTTLYLRIKEGRFPPPLKLSERVSVWKVEEILSIIDKTA